MPLASNVIDALEPAGALSSFQMLATENLPAVKTALDALLTYPFLERITAGNINVRTLVGDGDTRFLRLSYMNDRMARDVIAYGDAFEALLPVGIDVGVAVDSLASVASGYAAEAQVRTENYRAFFNDFKGYIVQLDTAITALSASPVLSKLKSLRTTLKDVFDISESLLVTRLWDDAVTRMETVRGITRAPSSGELDALKGSWQAVADGAEAYISATAGGELELGRRRRRRLEAAAAREEKPKIVPILGQASYSGLNEIEHTTHGILVGDRAEEQASPEWRFDLGRGAIDIAICDCIHSIPEISDIVCTDPRDGTKTATLYELLMWFHRKWYPLELSTSPGTRALVKRMVLGNSNGLDRIRLKLDLIEAGEVSRAVTKLKFSWKDITNVIEKSINECDVQLNEANILDSPDVVTLKRNKEDLRFALVKMTEIRSFLSEMSVDRSDVCIDLEDVSDFYAVIDSGIPPFVVEELQAKVQVCVAATFESAARYLAMTQS